MAFRTNKMPDLQEKSASGSVASFNTALAMPLNSCNIAVNAWQEGSGDPSPVNNRPIHGFSEVNATRAGKNLIINCDDEYTLTYPQFHTYNLGFTIKTNTRITISFNCELPSDSRLNIYNSNGTVNLANSSLGSNVVTFVASRDISAFRLYVANSNNLAISEAQLEVGSTPTAYEPYVTPTIYTIQLGQEVYGGVLDVVNGVAHVTHSIIDMGDIEWGYITSYANPYFVKGISYFRKSGTPIMTPIYKYDGFKGSSSAGNMANYCCGVHTTDPQIYIRDDRYTSGRDFQTAMAGIPLMCELAEPFDIQLTPTQIETLIGNNTIFADTGDIDLTYKDLDIAKRGNFREVFRLPS